MMVINKVWPKYLILVRKPSDEEMSIYHYRCLNRYHLNKLKLNE